MDPDDIELFHDESDVPPHRTSLARVLLTLAGAGLLVAILVIVLTTLATAGQPSVEALCGGEPTCTTLTVQQVSDLTSLALPADSEVVSSLYDSDAVHILVEATVRLPAGSANPFDGGVYFEVDASPLTLPADTTPFGLYGAIGENGALQADGALVTDDTGELVVVRVKRTL